MLGVAADRFATRWPEHDEEHPPGRRIDWRTVLCGAVGAVTFGLLPLKFAGDTLALVAFGAWFVTLVVGLATDLDQRLLPDELTLPVIPLALLYAVSGLNPLVGGALVFAIGAAVRHPGHPVPAVDPVRGRRVRDGRRQVPGRDGAHARWRTGASAGRCSG